MRKFSINYKSLWTHVSCDVGGGGGGGGVYCLEHVVQRGRVESGDSMYNDCRSCRVISNISIDREIIYCFHA